MALARGGMLFDGADLRAYDCTGGARGGTVVVTFPIAQPNQALDRLGFGEAFLAGRGIPAVVFTFSWNHWLQTREAEAALQAVLPTLRRFDRIVAYGASMGGFAACAASGALGADVILASAPRLSVDPVKAPWDGRDRPELARIQVNGGFCRDDMAAQLARDGELFLLYDPRLPRDREHAEAVLALSRRPRPLPLPFAGHTVTATLAATGLLSPFVASVIEGRPDVELRGKFRTCRRQSAHWWLGVARGALPRRPALAAEAARRAAICARPEDGLGEIAARLLARAGNARARAERAAAPPPPPPKRPRGLLGRLTSWVARRR